MRESACGAVSCDHCVVVGGILRAMGDEGTPNRLSYELWEHSCTTPARGPHFPPQTKTATDATAEMPPRGVLAAHGAFEDMAPSKEQLEFAAQRLREAGLIGDKMPTSNHTVGSMGFWKDMEAAMVKPMETAVDERTGPVRFRPMNPMCDAAEQGDLPTLTVLLATGGNVNELGENGNLALFHPWAQT